MHCQACKTLIETEVSDMDGVKNISVNYKDGSANLEFDETKTELNKIIVEIEKLNYKASEGPPADGEVRGSTKAKVVGIVVAIAGFSLVYYLINAMGGWEIMSRLNDPEVSFVLMFMIGFIASFHCVGMCGGIIISFNQGEKASKKPFQ